jgi:hypothetical protein
MSEQEAYQDLLKKYIELCDQAVQSAEKSFPFQYIWQAFKERLGQAPHKVEVKIYEDAPLCQNTLTFQQGELQLGSEPLQKPVEAVWSVKASYLKKVLSNADYYKDHPAQLDWSWLEDIMDYADKSKGMKV